MSVEGLQSVQHTVHQSELAAETHADPQRGQTIQGEDMAPKSAQRLPPVTLSTWSQR